MGIPARAYERKWQWYKVVWRSSICGDNRFLERMQSVKHRGIVSQTVWQRTLWLLCDMSDCVWHVFTLWSNYVWLWLNCEATMFGYFVACGYYPKLLSVANMWMWLLCEATMWYVATVQLHKGGEENGTCLGKDRRPITRWWLSYYYSLPISPWELHFFSCNSSSSSSSSFSFSAISTLTQL